MLQIDALKYNFLQEIDTKLSGLGADVLLTFCSFGASTEESHISHTIMHAEAAAKAGGGKAIAEHAEAAKTQTKTADEHLDAGIKSLDDAIEHGKLRHADLAKKSAEEARLVKPDRPV